MNKQEYLNELNKLLQDLPANERDDIIRDVEEYFHEAQLRGKTVEEIVIGLGTPEKMSETIKAEAKLKRLDQAETMSSKFKAFIAALVAVLLLTPFNLIFVLVPLLMATFLIILSWKLAFLACVSLPVVGFLSVVGVFFTGLHLLPVLGIIFFIIGWIGFVCVFVYSIAFVTYLYFKGVIWLLNWNLQFIKSKMKV